jgi:hypothetical protein
MLKITLPVHRLLHILGDREGFLCSTHNKNTTREDEFYVALIQSSPSFSVDKKKKRWFSTYVEIYFAASRYQNFHQ